MTTNEYWKWLADYVEECIKKSPFLIIHPAEPRDLAAKVWGFDGVIPTWRWQQENQAKIRRVVSSVAKKHGLKISKHRTGYLHLEKAK